MACGVLVPWLGIEPMSLALQGEFSTSKPPGKSPSRFFFFFFFYFLPKAPPTNRDTHSGTVVVKRKIVPFPFPLLCRWGRKPSRGAVSRALFLLDCPSGTALAHLFLLAGAGVVFFGFRNRLSKPLLLLLSLWGRNMFLCWFVLKYCVLPEKFCECVSVDVCLHVNVISPFLETSVACLSGKLL